jgi:hypothetical protein
MTFAAAPELAAQATSTRAHHLSPNGGEGWNLPAGVDTIKVVINGVTENYEFLFHSHSYTPMAPSLSNKDAPLTPKASITLYEHIADPHNETPGHWVQVGATKNYSHINKGEVDLKFSNGLTHYEMIFHGY